MEGKEIKTKTGEEGKIQRQAFDKFSNNRN